MKSIAMQTAPLRFRVGLAALVACTLMAFVPEQAEGKPVAKAVGKAAMKRLTKAPSSKTVAKASTQKQIKNAGAQVRISQDKTRQQFARQRVLRSLDNSTRQKIEKRYGSHISAERLRAGRVIESRFLPANEYRKQLQRSYPWIKPKQQRGVLGNYVDNKIYVKSNQVRTPRVAAHERLHQYSSPKFRKGAGHRLDEGVTEHYASKIYPGPHLKDLPKIYPQERRIAQMLEARAGEAPVARAYFRGDTIPLRKSIDSQVGKGSFDSLLRAVQRRDYVKANRILGPRSPADVVRKPLNVPKPR